MKMTEKEIAMMEKDIVIHEEMVGSKTVVIDWPSWHLGVAQTFKDTLKKVKKNNG